MKTEKDGSFSESDVDKDSRRAFLEKASAALVVIGAPPAQGNPPEDATGDTKESLFQPEHLWTDRMRVRTMANATAGLWIHVVVSGVMPAK